MFLAYCTSFNILDNLVFLLIIGVAVIWLYTLIDMDCYSGTKVIMIFAGRLLHYIQLSNSVFLVSCTFVGNKRVDSSGVERMTE